MFKRAVILLVAVISIIECAPAPSFDIKPSESIIDQLTDNFEIKTLKANKAANVKKLSGMFMKGQLQPNVETDVHSQSMSTSMSSSSSMSSDSNVNGGVPEVHSASQSNAMSMTNNNGEVKGLKLETAHNVQSDPTSPGQLVRQGQFKFEKFDPEGLVVFGDLQHPVYFTPFGVFKPASV